MTPPVVVIGVTPISADDVRAVAREGATVEVDDKVLAMLDERRRSIDAMATSGEAVYGVSTGFGSLQTTYVAPERRRDLQHALVRSHAAGAGDEIETEVVRAMMICRLRVLCSGVTGVRSDLVRAYVALLNAQITPVVYEYGSLGCSGDLAPLAHVALALLGEGDVRDATGAVRPAASALADAGLAPIALAEKEGLALINGTDGMLGMLALAVGDFARLMRAADVTAALSAQALLATDRAYAADLQELRPHRGQAASARNLTRLMANSPLVESHRYGDGRVQDAYSVRCVPQVHGAARDTLAHAIAVSDVELASAIDNPSVLDDGRLESNGNFHGAPLGYVSDFLAIVAADVASMSERRTDRLLDPARNGGLPAFLAQEPGVDSGLMIAQYTQAAIVSAMKLLASPASVDSIPTSAMQEDHVSMGWHACRKLRRSLRGLGEVLAVELIASARALAMIGHLEASPPARDVVAELARHGIVPGPDRPLAPDHRTAESLILQGRLEEVVEDSIGSLE